MASAFRYRFLQDFGVFVFAGVWLLAGWFGLSFLVESFNAHGSPGGNALLFALSLILLVLSLTTFIVGIAYWKQSRPSSADKNG